MRSKVHSFSSLSLLCKFLSTQTQIVLLFDFQSSSASNFCFKISSRPLFHSSGVEDFKQHKHKKRGGKKPIYRSHSVAEEFPCRPKEETEPARVFEPRDPEEKTMNRVAAVKIITPRQFLARHGKTLLTNQKILKPCDVFINHRGIDTKKTLAALLYDRLCRLNLRPFLDYRNLKPGEKLFDEIHGAIWKCKVGVAVFSPHYCESYFCLHELAMIMESKKKVIPIFCDIKPSQLHIENNGQYAPDELVRFRWALDEAKQFMGLNFDSSKGNLLEVVTNASDIVIRSVIEMEYEKQATSINF